MKGIIIIELESEKAEYVEEYMEFWKENEDSDNAYTAGPLHTIELGTDPDIWKKLKINCRYFKEEENE